MESRYRGSEREQHALKAFTVMNRAVDALQAAAFRRAPIPPELTMTQFEILEALLHLGPLTHTGIVEKILKTKGNISYMLKGLEEKGYVTSVVGEKDRRERLIRLTPAGRELIGDYFPYLARAFADSSAALTIEELDVLTKLAQRLGLGAAGSEERLTGGDAQHYTQGG
jgi:MarR family 2-MHQ and catechol resistance regulon transcriptional repressor